MIRVGFVVNLGDRGWIGGLNYIRNLVNAVWALPNRRLDPVLLDLGQADPDLVAGLAPCERIAGPGLAWTGWRGRLRRASLRLLDCDPVLGREAHRRGIEVLSHSGIVGRGARVVTVPWMADFQHVHLPHLFPVRERTARDSILRTYCRTADLIVVSSANALEDLRGQVPACAARSRCLRFVADLPSGTDPGAPERARLRHGLPERFFYLPNQFWVHKNHDVVIGALERLRDRKPRIVVAASGGGRDPRDPGYLQRLTQRVVASGLSDSFRNLGILPFEEVGALMSACVAVVNPSRFEGWSTTVEEAKSLGKQVILSDIAVHREQDPARAGYVGTDDPDGLAALLVDTLEGFDPREERRHADAARAALPGRRTAFAKAYEDIILEALAARTA